MYELMHNNAEWLNKSNYYCIYVNALSKMNEGDLVLASDKALIYIQLFLVTISINCKGVMVWMAVLK